MLAAAAATTGRRAAANALSLCPARPQNPARIPAPPYPRPRYRPMSRPTDDSILLLHNPKCSKSRATLALLEQRGATFEIRLYLENPLGEDELRDLGRRLGRSAIEFTRTKQAEFAAAGLTRDSSGAEILAAIATTPILLERPIVVRGDRARIGRPPETVLELLD